MNVIMTMEQYEKIRRLSDFADYYLDDYPRDSYPEQYESDKEDITQAQEVLQLIDAVSYTHLTLPTNREV